jgi:hypothetical protein
MQMSLVTVSSIRRSSICMGLTNVNSKRIFTVGIHVTGTGWIRMIAKHPGKMPVTVIGDRNHPADRPVLLKIIPGRADLIMLDDSANRRPNIFAVALIRNPA